MAEFKDLKGKTIARIRVDMDEVGNQGEDAIHFELTTGQEFVMFHDQQCIESVYVDEIVGDIDDILNKEILSAEESSNENETPEGLEAPEFYESYIWTFYRLNTIDSTLVIRWYGESEGYYSESVEFDEVEPEEPEEPKTERMAIDRIFPPPTIDKGDSKENIPPTQSSKTEKLNDRMYPPNNIFWETMMYDVKNRPTFRPMGAANPKIKK